MDETPIEKTQRLLALTDKLLNKKIVSEPILITATELLKINPSALKYEGQTDADDNGDYITYYSIHNKNYQVKCNLFG